MLSVRLWKEAVASSLTCGAKKRAPRLTVVPPREAGEQAAYAAYCYSSPAKRGRVGWGVRALEREGWPGPGSGSTAQLVFRSPAPEDA